MDIVTSAHEYAGAQLTGLGPAALPRQFGRSHQGLVHRVGALAAGLKFLTTLNRIRYILPSIQMSASAPTKINLYFYRTAGGSEPVRDWLKDQDEAERREIGLDLQRVQYRWPVGMPLCRSLGDGLWEARTSLPNKTISRVLLCFHDGELYALHGFIKKTQKTPDEDIKLARKRMKEVQDG